MTRLHRPSETHFTCVVGLIQMFGHLALNCNREDLPGDSNLMLTCLQYKHTRDTNTNVFHVQ